MKNLYLYLCNLRTAKIVLWCYLIWYCMIVYFYFDPKISLWITSIGISAVIGIALILSVLPAGGLRMMEKWQVVRLFMMPFCVSSFAALIKDHHFIVIFSPKATENLITAAICALFVAVTLACKFIGKTS